MDLFGDFFGTNPASPEERKSAAVEALREVEFDAVIQEGKVYVSVDQLNRVFSSTAKLLALRGLILQDERAVGASAGMETASSILTDISAEVLRREADAILKADNN